MLPRHEADEFARTCLTRAEERRGGGGCDQSLSLRMARSPTVSASQSLLEALARAQTLCAGLFLLLSLFTCSNSYSGFVSVLSGIMALTHAAATCFLLKRLRGDGLVYGGVLGSACGMVVVYLESAVFFGQYSACEKANVDRSDGSYGE